jgi:hypothetical protein
MKNKQAMVWRPCQQAQNLRMRNRDRHRDRHRDTERQSFGCTRNGGGAGSEVTSEECRCRCKGMAPIHTCLRACTVIARYSSSEEHTTALSSLPSPPPPPLLICLSLFFLLPQGTFLSAEEEEEKLSFTPDKPLGNNLLLLLCSAKMKNCFWLLRWISISHRSASRWKLDPQGSCSCRLLLLLLLLLLLVFCFPINP